MLMRSMHVPAWTARHDPCRHALRHALPYGRHAPNKTGAFSPFVNQSEASRNESMLCAMSGAAGAGGAGGSSQPAARNPFASVVLPTALALLVCNMDRICLSVAILPMAQEFGWPISMQGVIQSAFLYGYMATQLLGGVLADKYGGKLVMAGGIIWFSLASLLMPLALSSSTEASVALTVVLFARFCVGLGEGVVLPTMNNLVSTHIPPASKARALGMAFTGFHSGNLIGLLLSPLLLASFGWRALFLIFGILGGPIVAYWMATVPDGKGPLEVAKKEESDSAAADDAVGPLQLMSKKATWAIIIVNVVNHWGYFIYLNWMPTYFIKALGFDLRGSSFVSFLPWLVMAVGSSTAGVIADAMVSRGYSVTFTRKALQTVAFLVPAVACAVLATPGISTQVAVGAMTFALGTTSLGQAGFVANMSDIAPRHAGKMFGLCNTFGSLSGILGVTAVGFIVEATGSFNPVFYITSALYVVGTLAYLVMGTAERQF